MDICWKNMCKVQRLVMVYYLESSCRHFKNDSLANKESKQVGQDWREMTIVRISGNNSGEVVLNQLDETKIRSRRACTEIIAIVEPRADYFYGYCFCSFRG